MDNKTKSITQLTLVVPDHSIERFTTLLQAGVIIETDHATSIVELLTSLPGFSSKYISERVETIFLDGLPVDDLTQIINGRHPVLAISAVMPGLAGAIFRKNSFHAALRTTVPKNDDDLTERDGTVPVLLKLFNIVAREKGELLLNRGCVIYADKLLKFIHYRPQLFSEVLGCTIEGKVLRVDDLQNNLQLSDVVFLKVLTDNDVTRQHGNSIRNS